MTPDMMAAEIKKRLEKTATELLRCKRLHPDVYDKVVSTLAQMEWTEGDDEGGREKREEQIRLDGKE